MTFTGKERGDQWPGSRVISAQKANTANSFSPPGLALSTANLFSAVQPGGFLYGEGQGIISTQEGDMVTWKGQGAGKMKPGGGASYRGAIYFQNGSGKLARLNGTAAVFEHESDANDNVTSKYWEWK